MPRTALPPTPASSTDIHGKDGTKQLSSLQMAFELPPAAINKHKNSSPASPVSQHTSPKTPYPIQASETVKSRRRSSAAVAATAAAARDTTTSPATFALPPPPTRSRKIIQMKPRPQDEKKQAMEEQAIASMSGSSKSASKKTASAAAAASSSGTAEAGPSTKKKQPSATSAAGRKIARKTAHSLIERRRRSKMNEEFAVLKSMIPACTGEMHKLAILQASIEYVRYLQDCVEKLKAQTEPQSPTDMASNTSGQQEAAHTPEQQLHPHQQYHSHHAHTEQHSPDVEMTGSDIAPSPTVTTRPSSSNTLSPHHHQASASPALAPQDRHGSYSSLSGAVAAAEHHRHYSYSSGIGGASPAIGPGWAAAAYSHSAVGSALTSPALGPLREERDLDHEATAALLMLNSDRRGLGGSGGNGSGITSNSGRGMSVRDLLSA